MGKNRQSSVIRLSGCASFGPGICGSDLLALFTSELSKEVFKQRISFGRLCYVCHDCKMVRTVGLKEILQHCLLRGNREVPRFSLYG